MAVSAGPAFGTGGAGHVRLNYATSREVLEQDGSESAALVGVGDDECNLGRVAVALG